jgi:Flp pilus assembly protein TadG
MKTNRQVRGQGLVEFALILPLILLIIIVFIELGRIVYFYSALNNAVREGVRYAVVNQFANSTERKSEIDDIVAHYAVTMPINAADVSVYCDRDTTKITTNPCDKYMTVSADIQIAPMVPVFAQAIGVGSTFRITAKSTMQTTPYGNYQE